ncbi:hypothetical protein QM480_00655 [Flectobacillus sp. DC10W]|uniref:Outer membrane protein beta-barrel domain-containing protein n=1 Tax=Flectobacillus longus TaxID=2984207 RepID=A0ABT6YGV1_9BACT|nr:hypothetical protein [Flectobacillus longus]MDI9862814.1 hypothetical protein [Flectobacillus longus]
MKRIIILITLFILSGFSFIIQAQSEAENPKKTVATIIGGVSYVPKLHYYGRTDQLKSSAVMPTVLVQFDSVGLYFTGSTVFTTNSTQPLEYAATVTEVGYKFGKKQGIAGSIYGDKFFYQNKTLVQSALRGQAGLNLSHLNKVANVNLTSIAAFSDKTDFFASAGLEHPFVMKTGQSVFVITPTAVANAGTQSFTNTYFKNNKFLGIPVSNQSTTQTTQVFNLLSYEFSVPMVWVYNNIFLVVTPGYVMPQNELTTSGNTEVVSRTGTNLFYVNLSLLYSFKLKKV